MQADWLAVGPFEGVMVFLPTDSPEKQTVVFLAVTVQSLKSL